MAVEASGTDGARPYQYEVDFLDPDGSVAEHREGWGHSGEPACVAGAFTQEGEGSVLVRCVSDQGSVAGCRLPVRVESP